VGVFSSNSSSTSLVSYINIGMREAKPLVGISTVHLAGLYRFSLKNKVE